MKTSQCQSHHLESLDYLAQECQTQRHSGPKVKTESRANIDLC